jgi:hypothetical protein
MFANLEFIDEEFIHQVSKTFEDISLDDTEFIIESDDDEEEQKTVLGIDIGVRHLAFTLCTADSEYNLIDIVGLDMVDITTFPHHDKKNCTLHHQKTFSDWLEHVFEYYKIVFDSVDQILIERQPIFGLVVVEQLLFYKYRHKTILVSPNSMHKHFHIGHFDYDQRKVEVEKICVRYLRLQPVKKEYNKFERKHDMADAFCIAKFWLDTKHKEYIIAKERERIMNIQMSMVGSNLTMDQWFDQFRYRPRIHTY